MVYTGIGSRKTPEQVLLLMSNIAELLGERGYTLRSGGAGGADSAFEIGCDSVGGSKEIYLPWKNFNNRNSELNVVCESALELASRFHPRYKYLKRPAKLLMGRNGYQVLGNDLKTPVDFVICYTPNGDGGGGTGQAIRIAKHHDIPVHDLGSITVKDAETFVDTYVVL